MQLVPSRGRGGEGKKESIILASSRLPGGETVVHGLFREEKRRVVSCEAGNYGKLVLFDRSESVYFIDKLEVLTFPLGDTKDFPTGE